MKRIKVRLYLPVFALAGWLAACSDSTGPVIPTEPRAPINPVPPTPVATTVEASAANGQSATVGQAVQAAPAVLVKDNHGRPMSGITVRFTVTAGGGSVAAATALTDAQGIASAGSWTLGTSAGVNEVTAVVDNLAPVRFTASALLPPYNITIRYVATATQRQQQAVQNAVNRWQSVITTDLFNVPVNAPANTCFNGQPALNETVDDIVIFVELVPIDGIGKTLGEAGPCYVRTESSLPVVGHLKLDAADLQNMESLGTLDDVVMHEIGHILGIGTLWPSRNLLSGSGTQNPLFTGSAAIAAFRAMGGLDAGVPVENTGEAGTREGHWRETVFGNELMTGWVGGSPNPLSKLTIASLQDLGYGANQAAANTFQLGGTTGRFMAEPMQIEGHERIVKPKWKIDRKGKRTQADPE